ncbi:hypothetical protein VA596_27095 [Amycolatopsis sp., V23-08]|uniref:DUF6892 domain-containing protein n=1 Tax=Amycolatopsis heterodermiae TaxID=3110235 RepID=A0ABU5RAD4_9PSEU|nr:hypothetical protein [Amycolatopsis sp., V23-08]MEA5363226.1 hypothetical protein [Amycolatopsis sp., V23-08]
MTDFRDFNLKLIVVEQLMYTEKKLAPAFRIADVLGVTDPWDHTYQRGLAYQVVPEAREYFEALEIGAELLASVEQLVMDGGLQVYQECSPIWDGEDDLYDVTSLDDLALLPNLRRVVGSEFLGPELRDVLRARGIEAG